MAATQWAHYEFQPSFILGFHGCDKATGEKILAESGGHLNHSEEDYDWLGHGIYFWEGNPARAWEWATQWKARGKIKEPFVLGAIIDLRRCLDLFDSNALAQVAQTYALVESSMKVADVELPQNVGRGADKPLRRLDCYVMNALHEIRRGSELPPYDSIRGPFLEGEEIYPGAGFRSQNHIQICVRNTDCIKGYFRPIVSATASIAAA